jgi:hypothetical protein
MFKTSESTKNIFPAYVKAWAELDNATKASVNPHLKNKYADIASVLEAVKDTLASHGLAIMQPPSIGDNDKTVTVSTVLLHESGEWIESVLSMTAVDSKPQTIGATITYARRYSLNGLLCISAEDDDGNSGTGVTGPRDQPKPNPANKPKPQPQKEPTSDTKPDEPIDLQDGDATYAALINLGMNADAYKLFAKALFGLPMPQDKSNYIQPNADLYQKLSKEGPKTVELFNKSPESYGVKLASVYKQKGIDTTEATNAATAEPGLIELAGEVASNAGVKDGQTLIDKIKSYCNEDVSDENMLSFLKQYKKDKNSLKVLKKFLEEGKGMAGFIASIQ